MPSGYSFYAQQDLYLSDIDNCPYTAAKTVAELAAACDSTSGCTAFNLWQTQGDLAGQRSCKKNATYYDSLSVLSNTSMNNTCQGIFIRQDNKRKQANKGARMFTRARV